MATARSVAGRRSQIREADRLSLGKDVSASLKSFGPAVQKVSGAVLRAFHISLMICDGSLSSWRGGWRPNLLQELAHLQRTASIVFYAGTMLSASVLQLWLRSAWRRKLDHRACIRRWKPGLGSRASARGLLRAVRLPSGVRRFRPEDIAAVRAQMFSGFPAPSENDDVVAVTRARSID